MTDTPDAQSESGNARTPEPWEREALRDIALAGLKERRTARRWGIFFKLLGFGYLLFLLLVLMDALPTGEGPARGPHTALVDLKGMIADETPASADRMVSGLEKAFEDDNTRAVLLRINSPGGSPVQAAYIHDAIQRLRKAHPEVPLYAVISDMGASGGYYAAVAADRIYASPSSIVGSIGVRMDSFGFTEAMERLGIERRLLTAGEHKGLLDPFQPVDPVERDHIQRMLDGIHRQFVEAVREGRGERLKEDAELFTGLVWTGEKALELGLVDGLASAGDVAREVVGEPEVVDFTPREDLLSRLSRGVGAAVATTLESLEQGRVR
ncbi:signal peptide peptidase SppA [Ectothiorhodospira mobilis]|uniref:signal peptide peptidase SppA n=1 Tax=Ectothiorhodospira mobilis TaxID=195064 RepID=UPI001EE92B56|nr:signal peptide peptidase SppA [Ectothiorhodospira mobilis]MCG5535027.1 signal peptide peptidase SppA [Ectothiorhodospira mobilis]